MSGSPEALKKLLQFFMYKADIYAIVNEHAMYPHFGDITDVPVFVVKEDYPIECHPTGAVEFS